MRRTRLLAVFATLLLMAVAEAHVVQQLFAEVTRSGPDWEVEVLFDAGYAKPEWRGDPDSPQPTRQWLVAQSHDEQKALCKEAAAYLKKCLVFESDGTVIEILHHFIDFDQSPPDFPNILNDGAYLRIRLTPETPEAGSRVDCRLAGGDRPDFVFKTPSIDGSGPKYLTLRPGESFVLHQGDKPLPATAVENTVHEQSVYLHSLVQGFLHVLPGGLDHILFILALFLLQRSWKPLLWQSLAFTAAHTLTLGLTAAGIIAARSGWVEPVIALSIAALAVENLLLKECSRRRLALVFGFGLVHGMGFAEALSSLLTPGETFVTRLLLTNIGVELAQVTILGLAWVLTLRYCDGPHYETFRKTFNLIIAAIALAWLIERVA